MARQGLKTNFCTVSIDGDRTRVMEILHVAFHDVLVCFVEDLSEVPPGSDVHIETCDEEDMRTILTRIAVATQMTLEDLCSMNGINQDAMQMLD